MQTAQFTPALLSLDPRTSSGAAPESCCHCGHTHQRMDAADSHNLTLLSSEKSHWGGAPDGSSLEHGYVPAAWDVGNGNSDVSFKKAEWVAWKIPSM